MRIGCENTWGGLDWIGGRSDSERLKNLVRLVSRKYAKDRKDAKVYLNWPNRFISL
jgi:hypothetical protein